MEQPNSAKPENPKPSAGRVVPFKPEPVKSKSQLTIDQNERDRRFFEDHWQQWVKRNPPPLRELTETIDRVRAIPIRPSSPAVVVGVVHRVRNEHTEKELSPDPWCGVSWLEKPPTRATILDGDVTCPACIEIIGRRQVETGTVDIRSQSDLPLTHFDGGRGETLCGVLQAAPGIQLAATLRETTCQECQAAAEELLVGIVGDHGPSLQESTKPIMDMIQKTIDARHEGEETQQEIVSCLRDIAQTLKQLLGDTLSELLKERSAHVGG